MSTTSSETTVGMEEIEHVVTMMKRCRRTEERDGFMFLIEV